MVHKVTTSEPDSQSILPFSRGSLNRPAEQVLNEMKNPPPPEKLMPASDEDDSAPISHVSNVEEDDSSLAMSFQYEVTIEVIDKQTAGKVIEQLQRSMNDMKRTTGEFMDLGVSVSMVSKVYSPLLFFFFFLEFID
jgi:hypothetical protein